MKKYVKRCGFFLLLIAMGCYGPSTMINGSWTNPNEKKPYNRVLVAALTGNTIARVTLESDLVTALGAQGVYAEKSIDRFPPDLSHSDTDKTKLMDMVRQAQTDAVLTVSLLDQQTESRYVPGSYSYDPYGGYYYYRTLWGYYSYWSPYVYRPGYYDTDKTYFIETNLYDASTESLIWSAQSSTYSPGNLTSFSRDFAKVITREMQKNGVLNTQGSSPSSGR